MAYNWTSACQSAFDCLKQHLQSRPILKCPNFSSEFTLYTDASDTGLGAVLHQGEHVVAYSSRMLNKSERNYSVIEKECLALVYMLLSNFVITFTDHNPLVWLSSQKMQGELSRWSLSLQEYDYTIKYRKGSSNTNADALSRLAEDPCAVMEVQTGYSLSQLQEYQQKDNTLHKLTSYISRNIKPHTNLIRRTSNLDDGYNCGHSCLSKTVYSIGELKLLVVMSMM